MNEHIRFKEIDVKPCPDWNCQGRALFFRLHDTYGIRCRECEILAYGEVKGSPTFITEHMKLKVVKEWNSIERSVPPIHYNFLSGRDDE